MKELFYSTCLHAPKFESIYPEINFCELDLKAQAESFANQALALHSQGKRKEACKTAHKAIALDPLNNGYVEILKKVGTP